MPSRAPALSVPRMPTEIRYGPPAAGGRQRAKMVAEAVYHRHHAVSSTSAGRWRLELRRHRGGSYEVAAQVLDGAGLRGIEGIDAAVAGWDALIGRRAIARIRQQPHHIHRAQRVEGVEQARTGQVMVVGRLLED